jgi:hypothetical protein
MPSVSVIKKKIMNDPIEITASQKMKVQVSFNNEYYF